MSDEHSTRRRVLTASCVVGAALALSVPAVATATAAGAPRAVAATPAASPGSELAAASWWYDAMDVPQMHRTATGRGVTVAVIDGPFNAQVPELKGRFSAKSTCASADAQSSGPDATHGTSMAALIGGSGKGSVDGRGVRGIAPGAKVIGFTIAAPRGTSNLLQCRGGKDGMTAAIDAAVTAGAKVISISVAGGDNNTDAALGRAQRAGAIVVAATDDHQKTVGYPGTANGVVTVNAVDRKAQLAPFSAPYQVPGDIATAAPGMGVNRISPVGGQWRSNGYSDGSSPAAAIVSGGLALVWSHFPDASANQIIQLMTRTPGVKVAKGQDGKTGFFTSFRRSGEKLPSGETRTGFGYGLFDPADMLTGDPAKHPDVNPFLSPVDGLQPSYEEVTGKAAPATTGQTGTTTSAPSSTSQSATGSGSATPAPAQAAEPGSSAGVPGWVWVVGGLLLIGIAAGVALGVARTRSNDNNTERGAHHA